jgi:hypothetical protein
LAAEIHWISWNCVQLWRFVTRTFLHVSLRTEGPIRFLTQPYLLLIHILAARGADVKFRDSRAPMKKRIKNPGAFKADSHIPCRSPAVPLPCRSFPFDLHSAAVFDSHIPWHVMCESVLCVNQTRPHCVNQMGKTQSKPLAERHGRVTAWYVWIHLYCILEGWHRCLPTR